jgi:hypothetical protein
MYIKKLLAPLFALFLFSGCCEYLGICTSASVHTSISDRSSTLNKAPYRESNSRSNHPRAAADDAHSLFLMSLGS